MSGDFQQKILRVIEYQEFRRVRGAETIRVDVRIVAATNRDLKEAIRDGKFIDDLYDRLAFQVIEIPPLRDRPEDIPVLADFFLERFREEVPGIVAEEFEPRAIRLMGRYPWPGNVRELRFFVERVALLAGKPLITEATVLEHLPAEEPQEVPISERSTLSEQVDGFELRLLRYYLSRAGGSQKEAAKLAGITYDQWRYLYRKHKEQASM
jgi:DNA-binding NtrC family response regulator